MTNLKSPEELAREILFKFIENGYIEFIDDDGTLIEKAISEALTTERKRYEEVKAENERLILDMKLLPNQGHACDGFCLGTCLEGTRLKSKLSQSQAEAEGADLAYQSAQREITRLQALLSKAEEALKDLQDFKCAKEALDEISKWRKG